MAASGLWSFISGIMVIAMGTALWDVIKSGSLLVLGMLCLLAGAAVIPFIARKDEQNGESGAAALTLEQRQQQLQSLSREREPQAQQPRGNGHSRTLIIGAGTVGRALAEKLEATQRHHVVGFVDDEEIDAFGGKDWPILGPRRAASAIIRQYAIDEVFLAYAPTWQQELAEELARHNNLVRVQVVPSFYETMLCTQRIESIGDVAIVPMGMTREQGYDKIKRLFDVMASAGGLLLLFPVTALIALLIRLTSPGPVLFTQERVGRAGKPFLLYKFRTMRQDAEARTGPVLSAGKNDQRLTPIGRWMRLFRLDELPQLINVLRGEMSLIGPRPERPCFVEKFEARNPVYVRRHEVRPGITGLAQVHGGYHTDARDKLRFDLFYIAHRSMWLDLTIMWKTVSLMVIRPNGR